MTKFLVLSTKTIVNKVNFIVFNLKQTTDIPITVYNLATQEPAMSASPKSWLEKQSVRLNCTPTELKSKFNKIPSDQNAH